jgi:hypothetical protein
MDHCARHQQHQRYGRSPRTAARCPGPRHGKCRSRNVLSTAAHLRVCEALQEAISSRGGAEEKQLRGEPNQRAELQPSYTIDMYKLYSIFTVHGEEARAIGGDLASTARKSSPGCLTPSHSPGSSYA